MKKNNGLVYKIALFSAAVIWGSSFFVLKNAVDVLPPHFVLAVRFTIAFVIMSLICIKRYKNLNRDYLIKGGILGLTLFIAYSLQTLGLQGTTPGKNAFLTAGYCVMVPFFCWIFMKKRPDVFNIVAAVICLVGIGFVSLDGDLTMGMGDALTLASGVFYGLQMIFIPLFAKDKDILLMTLIQFFTVALLMSVTSLIFERPLPDLSAISGDTFFSVLYLALFATTLTVFLQNFGQAHTSPMAASLILSLESVFGTVFSLIFYAGEVLTLKLAIGFVLIFISIIISETKLAFLFPHNNKANSDEDNAT